MVGGVESRGMLPCENLDFLQPQKHYFRHSGRIFCSIIDAIAAV